MTTVLNKTKLNNLTNEIWKSAERLRGKFKAAQPKLTKENLGKYKIVVPPRTEQDIIAHYLDVKTSELKELTENIVDQITGLEQYCKSLIHECVTGKRRIE